MQQDAAVASTSQKTTAPVVGPSEKEKYAGHLRARIR